MNSSTIMLYLLKGLIDMTDFYKKLVMNMPLAYAKHRIVYDHKGNAVDYIFLDMNTQFEKITNLKKETLLGQRLTVSLPDTANDQTDWIATYAAVVKNDTPISFTTYVASLNTHYQITAFKTDIDEFVTIFEDVSNHVYNTQNLIEANNCLKEHNRILYQKSVTDSLTNFFNHNYIRELLKDELTHSLTHNTSLSIAMIDIDHFKRVNDTYGHLTGDEVLVMLSDLIRKQVRKCDHVGRYGGEEFLLILPGTEIYAANAIIDRIRSAIASFTFRVRQHDISVTVSCGLSSYKGQSLHQLIEEADRHMYEAKKQGRNTCLYSTN